MEITILGFERISDSLLKAVKTAVELKFGAKVKIENGLFLPPAKIREGQLEADSFIAPVAAKGRGSYSLGITEKDIYIEGKDFVFGLAIPPMKSVIVSLARLKSRSSRMTEERLIRVVIHELGHAIYNLTHCSNNRCAMYHADNLKELDSRISSFCHNCMGAIKQEKERLGKDAETKNFFEEVEELWKRRKFKMT